MAERGERAPGRPGAQVNCGIVKVTESIDRSSQDLIWGVATGRHFPMAVITFRKAGAPFDYYDA